MPDETVLTTVTSEQFSAILADLKQLLKLEQKKKESLRDYAIRLSKVASDEDKVGKDDWDTLKDQTQMWVNGMTTALENGSDLPLPPEEEAAGDGAGDDTGDGNDGEEQEEQEENVEKTATASSGKKKGGAAKSAAKSKGAAKSAAKKNGAATAKKAAAGSASARRGPKGNFDADSKIKTVVKENPFREGTKAADCFKHYKVGATVATVLKSVPRSKFARHVKRGVVTLA